MIYSVLTKEEARKFLLEVFGDQIDRIECLNKIKDVEDYDWCSKYSLNIDLNELIIVGYHSTSGSEVLTQIQKKGLLPISSQFKDGGYIKKFLLRYDIDFDLETKYYRHIKKDAGKEIGQDVLKKFKPSNDNISFSLLPRKSSDTGIFNKGCPEILYNIDNDKNFKSLICLSIEHEWVNSHNGRKVLKVRVKYTDLNKGRGGFIDDNDEKFIGKLISIALSVYNGNFNTHYCFETNEGVSICSDNITVMSDDELKKYFEETNE